MNAMTNRAKSKGDSGEREAVEFLSNRVPDLLVPTPQRRLGLGRHEDTGDLDAFKYAIVQVKTFSDISTAIRSAVHGAREQTARAQVPFGVGMAAVPRKQKSSLTRWVFCTLDWPGETLDVDFICKDAKTALLVLECSQHKPMLASIERGTSEVVYLSWLPRWAADYELALKEKGYGQ